MRNTILLVGGDLCRHIALGLDPQQWRITGLRRHPSEDSVIDWIRADLRAPESLRGLPDNISHVVYAPSPAGLDPASYQKVYPDGLHNLLAVLRERANLRRVVLVGSTAVWAPADPAQPDVWVDEATPANPENFRGEAILQAEDELWRQLPGRGTALRLGGIYRPGRSRLFERLRADRITVPTGPGHWSNRIHIADAASACIHLLTLADPAACYIGTDGHPREKCRFYDQLADLLGAPRPPGKPMPPSGKRLSNARLAASGWSPRWPDALAGYRAILNG